MKKTSAILLFFCCNALLIFFEVHKQGQYLQLSYQLQKLQSQISILHKEHDHLVYALHELQQPNVIQNIAEKKFGMKHIELKNIHPLSVPKTTLVIT